MRHLRWQALIALLGLVLVGGLLAGQGRSVTYLPQPERGGLYAEALVGGPRWLNPLLDQSNPVDRDIDRLIFSGLTRFDSDGRPAPDLAVWSISADQLTYQFILKPGVKWHDGRPLTTADVAFTVSLLQDPAYPGPADVGKLWQSLKVNVIGPQIIEFVLPEPFAPFLDYTAVGILPRHLLMGVPAASLSLQSFNQKPVGSGPYAFGNWLSGQDGALGGVVLNAFADYYGPRPLLNQWQFNFYPDAAAAFAAYKDEKVQGVGRLAGAQLGEALQMPQLGLHTTLFPAYSAIFLNQRNTELPFFADKKVRQALWYGLNRSAMVNDILQGQAQVADSPILPGSWAYNPNLPAVKYSPQKAADLLSAAGWVLPEGAVAGTPGYVRQKSGVPLQFSLITPDDPVHLAVAQSARKTWAALGVSVTITATTASAIRDQYLAPPRAFQAILVDLNFSGTPDPDPYPFWHETQAESGQNYGGVSDRVISEYLEQARITTDMATRARRYQSFQARFVDQAPALLLYYPVYNYGVDTKVGGVQVGFMTEPSDRFNNLANWHLVTKRVIAEQPEAAPTP